MVMVLIEKYGSPACKYEIWLFKGSYLYIVLFSIWILTFFAFQLKLLTAVTSNAVVTTTKDQLDPKAAHVCGGHTTAYYKEASA